MIQLFGTGPHHGLIGNFFDSWMPAARAQIRTLPYSRFSARKRFPSGAVIFSDLERLRPEELSLAARLAEALRSQPEAYTVWNDPCRYAGRFQLLKILEANGINDYRVYRADEPHDKLRFPVFVRHELNHDGPATPLLHSAGELHHALSQAEFQPLPVRRQLMIVEYCDCVQDGIFRKYSVMKAGSAIIPRHVLFSREWSTKTPDLVTGESLREEHEFFFNFPHKETVQKAFQLAGLDYGRIDYGLSGGKIQIWEINTNPTVVPVREKMDPRRMPIQSESARQIAEAILNLPQPDKTPAPRPFFRPYFFYAATKYRIRRRQGDDRH